MEEFFIYFCSNRRRDEKLTVAVEEIVGEILDTPKQNAVSSAKNEKSRISPTIRQFPSANRNFTDESPVSVGGESNSPTIRQNHRRDSTITDDSTILTHHEANLLDEKLR